MVSDVQHMRSDALNRYVELPDLPVNVIFMLIIDTVILQCGAAFGVDMKQMQPSVFYPESFDDPHVIHGMGKLMRNNVSVCHRKKQALVSDFKDLRIKGQSRCRQSEDDKKGTKEPAMPPLCKIPHHAFMVMPFSV